MAAFTSTQSGNWNSASTWGGAGYPFQSSAADTATIASGHVVTITADNTLAGTGAVTVNGELTISNHSCSQSFCGAVTVNSGGKLSSADDSNIKKLWVKNGNVTINSGGVFDWNKNSELYIETATANGNGLDCKSGSQFALNGTDGTNDCKISGASGKQIWVRFWMQSAGLLHEVKNAKVDYCGRYDASNYPGGVNFIWANAYDRNLVVDNLIVDHPSEIGVYGYLCSLDSEFSNVTVNATQDKLFYFKQCALTNGFELNINHTASASYEIANFTNSVLDGVVFTAHVTGGTFSCWPFVLSNSHVKSGTYTITRGSTDTSPQGFNLGTGTVHGGDFSYTYAGTTKNNFSYSLVRSAVSGGTFLTDAPGTGMYCEEALLSGGTFTVRNSGSGSYYGIYPYLSIMKSGGGFNLIIEGSCATGINNQYCMNIQLEHSPDGYCVNEATTDVANASASQHVEPWIYVTSRSSKYFKIWFNCWPWNKGDFTTTGQVNFNPTTAGQIDISSGGSVTFPRVQPWQTLSWGTVSYTESGAGTSLWEYRISNDGGATWGDWTTFASGTSLSSQPAKGRGLDSIEFRVSVSGGEKSVSELKMTNCVYDSLDGWDAKDWLLPEMKPIKRLSENSAYWQRY